MPLRFGHAGDFHLDEDRYFADTAQCLEWLVADAIQASVDLFVINGDLTTYKATIKERNFWVDRLVEMADHAPVILVAGNHGAELEGDLYVFGRAKGKHPIYLCTEPQFIEVGEAAVAVFPYPRKAVMADNQHSLGEAFARQLDEFNQRFEQRPRCYKLFFGHFGVAGAKVSSGQPLVGRCAEYPLDLLRSLKAQYVGLSHVHLGDTEYSRASPELVRPDR
jgi:DNA repair exonuclease SbcCD nuclease subunit